MFFLIKRSLGYFREKQEGRPGHPKLSVVVVSYNMDRELSRTIRTLLPPYQKNISKGDIEIIIVDNGSSKAPSLRDVVFKENVRIVYNPKVTPIPCRGDKLGY